MSWTITRRFNTAYEFLDAMSPLDGIFPADYRGQNYIFRGLGSATYDLVPSAFRKGVLLREYNGCAEAPLPTVERQAFAELTTAVEFFRAADSRGLRLPEDSQALRGRLARFRSAGELSSAIGKGEEQWPPDDLLSLLALGQHYGLPTRILDWSWDPYIAAYFASSSAARKTDCDMCVWAVNLVHDELVSILMPTASRRLVLVNAPAADNDHLRAQRWVGMVYREDKNTISGQFSQKSYDQLAKDGFGDDLIFWKITLPCTEAGEVLRLLAAHGVDAASVFPTFSGVAQSIQEMCLWPHQGDWRRGSRPPIYWKRNKQFWSLYGPDKDT